RIARTKRLAEAARAAVEALGLELFPDRRFASNTVSAIRYPEEVEDAKFRQILRERHRTIVAGGQDHLKGRVFRIGHMGICTFEDLDVGFRAIEAPLPAGQCSFSEGLGVEAIGARTPSPWCDCGGWRRPG